jgi:hypothetical protein
LATAMIGFPNCFSFMPFARQRLLAPAIFLPCVLTELRSGIAMTSLLNE